MTETRTAYAVSYIVTFAAGAVASTFTSMGAAPAGAVALAAFVVWDRVTARRKTRSWTGTPAYLDDADQGGDSA